MISSSSSSNIINSSISSIIMGMGLGGLQHLLEARGEAMSQ